MVQTFSFSCNFVFLLTDLEYESDIMNKAISLRKKFGTFLENTSDFIRSLHNQGNVDEVKLFKVCKFLKMILAVKSPPELFYDIRNSWHVKFFKSTSIHTNCYKISSWILKVLSSLHVLKEWRRKVAGMGVPIPDGQTFYTFYFANDQIIKA